MKKALSLMLALALIALALAACEGMTTTRTTTATEAPAQNTAEPTAEPTAKPTKTPPAYQVPKTGDSSNIVLWIVLVVLGIAGVTVVKRKTK